MNGERQELSAREREIMDVVYRRRRVTVAELGEELADAPTASAIRTMLTRLEEKGRLRHERDGRENVYWPTLPREEARTVALGRVLETFFGRSPIEAVAAILDRSAEEISDEELDRLEALVEEARRRER